MPSSRSVRRSSPETPERGPVTADSGAVAAVAGRAPGAAVVAGEIEEQPSAALALAPTQPRKVGPRQELDERDGEPVHDGRQRLARCTGERHRPGQSPARGGDPRGGPGHGPKVAGPDGVQCRPDLRVVTTGGR